MSTSKNTGQFGAGNPGKPKGAVNKTTKALREAVVEAAETVGQDGKGKDGLVGYLVGLAQKDPRSFSSLLGRAMPLQVVGEGDGPLTVVIRKMTDA